MPKILKILTNPNTLLRKISTEVKLKTFSKKKKEELIPNMIKTMIKKDGIGLAAPQIGLNTRIIIINTKDGPIAMFNPVITKKSWAKAWDEEGCLSVPDTFGKVKRFKKINCVYYDINNKKIKIQADGLMARVIQHEIDHLDGILFIDNATNIRKIQKN